VLVAVPSLAFFVRQSLFGFDAMVERPLLRSIAHPIFPSIYFFIH
jgi:hypothetical protein